MGQNPDSRVYKARKKEARDVADALPARHVGFDR